MRKNIVCILCLLWILGVSCNRSINSPPEDTMERRSATPIPLQTEPILFLPTTNPLDLPPNQPTRETPLPFHNPTLESYLLKGFQYQCKQIMSDLPQDNNRAGSLILQDRIEGSHQVYLFNINNNTKVLIPKGENDTLIEFSVSPDRNWLAYYRLVSNASNQAVSQVLEIIDKNGKVYKAIPWEPNWDWLYGWLGINQLEILIKTKQASLAPALILNPFTGERKEIYPDLLDIYFPYNPTFSFQTSYDPALTRVVYPSQEKSGFFNLILKDLSTDQVLASPRSDIFYTPQWTQDGQKIFFVAPTYFDEQSGYNGNEELFIMSRDGRIDQITNISRYFPTILYGHYYSWSPDGKQVALWIDNEAGDYPGERLAILDTTTKKLTNYCIPGDLHNITKAPIWSPDGQYLLVESRTLEEAESRAILVSLNKGYAAEVAKNVEPIGWLEAP